MFQYEVRSQVQDSESSKRILLHICTRETIRLLRDDVLRRHGFEVFSSFTYAEGLAMFNQRQYDLVLIDVETDTHVGIAEEICSEIKSARPEQTVAFACNWRVANETDCPDEVVRTEFDPVAFAQGVSAITPPPSS
jgi:CheY-like chemotaxis protein